MSSLRIVIQHIHLMWTKTARGGNAARWRNALPRHFPLPLESFAAPVTLHRIDYPEWMGPEHRERIERYKSVAKLDVRDLSIEMRDDSLVVRHVRDRHNAAIADRLYPDESGNTVFEVDAFCLSLDEWGQLRSNGRYVDIDTGNWWYEQSVYNIGLFSGVDVRRFVSTIPDHQFVEMASLR